MEIIHTEFFSSKAEAKAAGKKLVSKGFSFNIRWAMRADGSHDWLLEVLA